MAILWKFGKFTEKHPGGSIFLIKVGSCCSKHSYKANQIFQCFFPWLALLIFQPYCGIDLREYHLLAKINHPKRFLKNSWFVIFGEFSRNFLLKSSIRCSAVLLSTLHRLACGINSKSTEVESNIMPKSDNSNARILE